MTIETAQTVNLVCWAIAILSTAALLIMCSAKFFANHEACKPETEPDATEGPTCPFCESLLKLDQDGMLSCDCPEARDAQSLSYCPKHHIAHTGSQCPRCVGAEVWLS